MQAIDGGSSAYITPNSFPVSNDNWQITIHTAADALVFGPAGEGLASNPALGCDPPPVGVNSREMFKLEADPSAVVERCSHSYNDGKSSTFGAPNVWNSGAAVAELLGAAPGSPAARSATPTACRTTATTRARSGDHPCAAGVITGCDDNCPGEPNPSQLDTGRVGPGGGDGIGDACQCGDVNNNGSVTATDRTQLRQKLASTFAAVNARRKCGG